MWKAWTDTLNEGYADHFHPKSTPKIVKQQQQKHPDKKKSMESQRKVKGNSNTTRLEFWNWGKANAKQTLGSEAAYNPKNARISTSQPHFWLRKITIWKSTEIENIKRSSDFY